MALALPLAIAATTPLRAQDDAPAPGLHARLSGPILSDSVADATAPTVFTGLLSIANNPPADKSGNGYWPCFTGGSDTDCSSIPKGAIVVGEPLSAAVVSHVCSGCAQIYWIVESTTAAKSGDVKISISVKQGSTSIFTFSGDSGTTLPPGQIGAFWYSGVTFNSSAKAGEATITVTSTVGTVKSTASTTILLK